MPWRVRRSLLFGQVNEGALIPFETGASLEETARSFAAACVSTIASLLLRRVVEIAVLVGAIWVKAAHVFRHTCFEVFVFCLESFVY